MCQAYIKFISTNIIELFVGQQKIWGWYLEREKKV